MAKQLTFTYGDKDYTLEYTRSSIRTMERQGFIADDISRKPMTTIPDLFAGAFLAHHSTTKRKQIDEIYENLNGKLDLIAALTEMYNDAVETLIDSKDEGNANWTKNW